MHSIKFMQIDCCCSLVSREKTYDAERMAKQFRSHAKRKLCALCSVLCVWCVTQRQVHFTTVRAMMINKARSTEFIGPMCCWCWWWCYCCWLKQQQQLLHQTNNGPRRTSFLSYDERSRAHKQIEATRWDEMRLSHNLSNFARALN